MTPDKHERIAMARKHHVMPEQRRINALHNEIRLYKEQIREYHAWIKSFMDSDHTRYPDRIEGRRKVISGIESGMIKRWGMLINLYTKIHGAYKPEINLMADHDLVSPATIMKNQSEYYALVKKLYNL